jgi:hypothetical protein
MGEPVYRSEQVGIRLVNRGSTFAGRVRQWLKAARGPFIAYAGACVAIAVVLLGGMGILALHSPAYDDEEGRRWIVGAGVILAGALAAGLGPLLVLSVVRSIPPDPGDQLLPRELHLFEDHVWVVPFAGAGFHAPWGAYVLGATEASGGMQLLLGREPRLEFFVRRRALSVAQWEILRRWLEAQGLMRGDN